MIKTKKLAILAMMCLSPMAALAQTMNVPGPFIFADSLNGNEAGLNSAVQSAGAVTNPYAFGAWAVVDSINLTSVLSRTYVSEARVRMVNSAYPTLNAQLQFGTLSAYTTFTISSPTVCYYTSNGLGGAFIPSNSTWDLTFFESFNDGPGADSIGSSLIFTPAEFVSFDPAPVAVDLGVIDLNNTSVTASVPPLAASEVRWYKFTLGESASFFNDAWFDVWTSRSNSTTVNIDTEIGIYNVGGQLLSTDDNDSEGLWSALSYGSGVNPAFGDGREFDGRDGSISASTYYLAASRFNTTFVNIGSLVLSTGAATTVPFDLNLKFGLRQVLTGNLTLSDTVFGSDYTRDIEGTIKQGDDVIGVFTVFGFESSTLEWTAAISSEYTGPATIKFDGSSFLRKATEINLSGLGQNVDTIVLQNGDVDGSGEVDAADIDLVIADFGDTNGNDTDVDVSGEVDAADIDIVISNFGGTDN